LRLYDSLQALTEATGCSRSIRVTDTTSRNRAWWANPDEVVDQTGVIVHRNRKGIVVGAIVVAHISAATASKISSHAKGDAYEQILANGRCWALTGVRA
jgi:hypothetical protein